MRLAQIAAIVIALLATAYPSLAADVTFEGVIVTRYGKEARFHLKGNITLGDASSVRTNLAKYRMSNQQDPSARIVFALDSPGGSYHAGLDLALVFRREGVATEVREGESCFSACAIAFLGGSKPLHDPTRLDDNSPLPNQPPDRSIAVRSQLGFHAPYLDIPVSTYTAEAVESAYRSAVLAIARLIAIADGLYISTAELPRLLKPDRGEAFMVDTVDAVGFLGVDYTERSLQMRNLPGVTQSMIINACINRFYHLQRRSSMPGYPIAGAAIDEFVEGSKLLRNGEDILAFGTRRMKYGTISSWVAFVPIAKTWDGKSFIWCIFGPGHSEYATTFYKPAGTISELFNEVKGNGDVNSFSSSSTTMQIGVDMGWVEKMLRVRDMVPPQTKLAQVTSTIQRYLKQEKIVQSK